MMIQCGKCSKEFRGSWGRGFNCLRQLNKVSWFLKKESSSWQRRGGGGECVRENSMYKGGKPNRLPPKWEKLGSPECGARKDQAAKSFRKDPEYRAAMFALNSIRGERQWRLLKQRHNQIWGLNRSH